MTQPPPAPPESGSAGPRLIRLGSVLGVGVFIAPSWLLIAALITLSYGDFLRQVIPGTSTASGYALAFGFAVIVGVSVVLHEIGHTVVSLLLGLKVSRIVVFLLGGVSELEGEARRPRDEFAIAAAGPAVSFLLAGLCWLASWLPAGGSAPNVMLVLAAWSNLIIAVFNVLPGLPLDGGRLLQAAVWTLSRSRSTGVRIAAYSGRGLAVLLAGGVFAANAALRNTGVDAITLAVIGLGVAGFLWFGAGQTLRAAELTDRTGRLRLGQLIRPSVYLPAATPLSEALRFAAGARAGGIVVVDGDGRSRAIVDEAEVARIEQTRRPWISLADVARPLQNGLILRDDLTGEALLAAVRTAPATEYLIIGADGVSRGVLATSDLARALRLRYRHD